MSFDYVGIRAEAQAILADFGFAMTINRYSYVSDPVAGTVVKTLQATQTLTAVILPASKGTLEAFDVRFMSDVLESTDVRFGILAAEGAVFQPEPKDEAVFFGATWDIMGCTPLNVAGTALTYSVGFKKP